MRQKEIPEEVKIVGQNINDLLKQKNLKISTVAHDADMDSEALRRYVKSTQIMGIDKAIKIARALQVDISELFKGI